MVLDVGLASVEVTILLFGELGMSGVEVGLVLVGRTCTLGGAFAGFAELDHDVYN